VNLSEWNESEKNNEEGSFLSSERNFFLSLYFQTISLYLRQHFFLSDFFTKDSFSFSWAEEIFLQQNVCSYDKNIYTFLYSCYVLSTLLFFWIFSGFYH
jgi:hypothetical protein